MTRRTREIGIRVAVGAQPRDVLRIVFREAMVLTAIAIAGGVGGAWALARYVRSLLYQCRSSTD